MEITDLTEDVSEGVKSASQVARQVDQSLDGARKQAQNLQVGTRSIFVGVKTAWKTFTRQKTTRRAVERLSITEPSSFALREREALKAENRLPKAEAYRSHDGYSEASNWNNGIDDEEFP